MPSTNCRSQAGRIGTHSSDFEAPVDTEDTKGRELADGPLRRTNREQCELRGSGSEKVIEICAVFYLVKHRQETFGRGDTGAKLCGPFEGLL